MHLLCNRYETVILLYPIDTRFVLISAQNQIASAPNPDTRSRLPTLVAINAHHHRVGYSSSIHFAIWFFLLLTLRTVTLALAGSARVSSEARNLDFYDSVASLPKHCSISPQRRGGRGENLEKTLRPLRLGGELTKRRWACYSLEIRHRKWHGKKNLCGCDCFCNRASASNIF